jgi:hypothetical protein
MSSENCGLPPNLSQQNKSRYSLTHQFFDASEVRQALILTRSLTSNSDREGESVIKTLEIVQQNCAAKPVIEPTEKVINNLLHLCKPEGSFNSCIEFIVSQIKMMKLVEPKDRSFRPVLVQGKPGIGKTKMVSKISKALGVPIFFQDASQIMSAVELIGTPRQYNQAGPGILAKVLMHLDHGSPAFCWDELDKLPDGGNHPSLGIFLNLFEPITAQLGVRDTYLEIYANTKSIMHFGTCNDLKKVHPALRSRMAIFEIGPTSFAERLSICKEICEEGYPNIHFNPDCHQYLASLGDDFRRVSMIIQAAIGDIADQVNWSPIVEQDPYNFGRELRYFVPPEAELGIASLEKSCRRLGLVPNSSIQINRNVIH